jgi:hypothetical protein
VNALRLRPQSSLLPRGIAAVLAFFVPSFGVLFFLTVPNGPWQVVLAAAVVVVGLFAYSIFSYTRLGVWVTPESIAERGYFSITKHYTIDELGSMVLVDTYRGSLADAVPQLFVCDPAGKQLIRLRGQFWSRESMQLIASTLDVPLTELDRPLQNKELRALYPGLLYWFERRPVLTALVFGSIFLVAGALLYALLTALGVTF